MSDNFWKRLWEVGAWHNFIGAAVMVFGHDWVYTRSGLDPPVPGIHFDTWIGLVFVFGIAYWFVSRDLYGNLDLVRVSILAKITSATPQLIYWIYKPELLASIFIIPMITDYSFAALYYWFLRHAKRKLPRSA